MDFHTWECISPGEYDSTYKCSRCGEIRTESIDNPDTALPARGCNESASPGGYPAWIWCEDRLPDGDEPRHLLVTAEYADKERFVSCCSYLPKFGGFDHYHAKVVAWAELPPPAG